MKNAYNPSCFNASALNRLRNVSAETERMSTLQGSVGIGKRDLEDPLSDMIDGAYPRVFFGVCQILVCFFLFILLVFNFLI